MAFSELQFFPVLQKAQGSIFTMICFAEEGLCDICDLHQTVEDSGQESKLVNIAKIAKQLQSRLLKYLLTYETIILSAKGKSNSDPEHTSMLSIFQHTNKSFYQAVMHAIAQIKKSEDLTCHKRQTLS